ncbi:uncharacterized protein [Lepidochelys kempii]|uniref:uncharacterized protein n=1 Tax=Lepidochelys kempii TaxID=8472 RepID=UPI003C6EB352
MGILPTNSPEGDMAWRTEDEVQFSDSRLYPVALGCHLRRLEDCAKLFPGEGAKGLEDTPEEGNPKCTFLGSQRGFCTWLVAASTHPRQLPPTYYQGLAERQVSAEERHFPCSLYETGAQTWHGLEEPKSQLSRTDFPHAFPMVETLVECVYTLVEGAFKDQGPQNDGEGKGGGAAEEHTVQLGAQRYGGLLRQLQMYCSITGTAQAYCTSCREASHQMHPMVVKVLWGPLQSPHHSCSGAQLLW